MSSIRILARKGIRPAASSSAAALKASYSTRANPYTLPRPSTLLPTPARLHPTPRSALHRPSIRWESTSPSPPKPYDFAAVKTLSTTPNPSTILIDVREPGEFAAGAIPSAVNIPLASQPDALFLPADEFEERFGFAKPDVDEHEVVFYCKAGVRSAAAARLAGQAGYARVGEYKGSWLDWEKRSAA